MQVDENVFWFLAKSVIGRNTVFHNSECLIKACIKKAYGDMMTGGRFFSIKDDGTNVDRIYSLFDKEQYVFSIDLIEKVRMSLFGDTERLNNGKRSATCFGLAQKIVNMTFKYLYCFRDSLADKHIDFMKCDCPVDSVIINQAMREPEIKLKETYAWTRMTRDQYKDFQRAIDGWMKDVPSYSCSKRLAFDFNW